jgi:CRP-like cAMP-binding protein
LVVWDAAAFEALTRRIGTIHRNAIAIMRSRLKMLQERFCDVATRPVPQRLARLVLHLAEKAPGSFGPVELSREELAQMAGTSLFTVSRLLSAWADEDIVTVERKTVVIEDLPRLLELTEAT